MTDTDPLGDLDFDPVAEIAEEVIAEFIDQGYRTLCAAGGTELTGQKAADQLRYLYYAEPWLPALTIRNRLRDAGLVIGA